MSLFQNESMETLSCENELNFHQENEMATRNWPIPYSSLALYSYHLRNAFTVSKSTHLHWIIN